MSTVYLLEPPKKGKVVLNTTHGPLDVELWPKEAPKGVRNFVQLCLEGYYDDIIFHRIIKDFLVQDGDPTGTGTSGESIYGGAFVDEHHSRIRFKHRGLAACANEGRPHYNGSQFFITLDRCSWLDKKHTIFWKVYDNIYFHNLLGFANDIQLSVRDALSSKKDASLRESGAGFFSSSKESDDDNDEDEVSFDARMHRQILKKREEIFDLPSTSKLPDGVYVIYMHYIMCVLVFVAVETISYKFFCCP